MPAIVRALSREPRQTSAIVRTLCRIVSALAVVTVGQNCVTPNEACMSAIAATFSAVKPGELNSWPPQPLDCKSTNPGAIQGNVPSARSPADNSRTPDTLVPAQ